jgi:DNA polymerase-3 subunit chi
MTKVEFYTGVTDKLRTACMLSHEAMLGGVKVLLHTPDAATTLALDELLWHYPATGFLPHCTNEEAAVHDMPIVLGHIENFPHSQLLISLHLDCMPFFSRFERVIEIVTQDPEDARRGRERFSFYRDRGYEISHFDLRKQAND